MRNLKLTMAYDGSDFYGWQTQPGFRTVQATLRAAIAEITGEKRIRGNAAGRTDAGVHALGQVANFFTVCRLDCDTMLRAINAHLPVDVAVCGVDEMPQSFDANHDAIRKLYRYVIHDGEVASP